MAVIPAGNAKSDPWDYEDTFKQQNQSGLLYQQMAMKMHDALLDNKERTAAGERAFDQKKQLVAQRAASKPKEGNSLTTPEEDIGLATGKLGYVKGAEIDPLNVTGTPVRPIKNKSGMIQGWIVSKERPGAAPPAASAGAAAPPPTASPPTAAPIASPAGPETRKVVGPDGKPRYIYNGRQVTEPKSGW